MWFTRSRSSAGEADRALSRSASSDSPVWCHQVEAVEAGDQHDRCMVNELSLNLDQPAYAAAFAELQRLTGQARGAPPEVAGTTGNFTVTSTLRGDHHTVVTVGGSIDARAL